MFKIMSGWIVVACFLTGVATAQSPVTLTVSTQARGKPIPSGFIGWSFETGSLHYNHYKPHAYFFDSTNARLLTLFRNIGIRTLRLGGNSVDRGYVPSRRAINALFRFVKASGVKVIYSLRLANGNPQQDARTARYLWTHYRKYIVCLAIGNEPNSYNGLDRQITGFPSFIAKWNKFASAIVAAVPDVELGGPDNGNGSTFWSTSFARDEKGNRNVAEILCHYEPGGPSRGKTPRQLINEMLSPACDNRWYPTCYRRVGLMAQSLGFAYRFSEANSQVATPTSRGGNHSFATALFALDFMHWWAEHDCRGINFHTGLGGWNGEFFLNSNGSYQPYPIAYGVAAFNVGGHGVADSVVITNPDHLNLTAYAVSARHRHMFITIINKEHGRHARAALVRINAVGTQVSAMYLMAPQNDVADTAGITLGGAAISSARQWHGQWKLLEFSNKPGVTVKVPASSAAIVRFTGMRIDVRRD